MCFPNTNYYKLSPVEYIGEKYEIRDSSPECLTLDISPNGEREKLEYIRMSPIIKGAQKVKTKPSNLKSDFCVAREMLITRKVDRGTASVWGRLRTTYGGPFDPGGKVGSVKIFWAKIMFMTVDIHTN